MDEHSMVRLLDPGHSLIYLSERYEERIGCGLVPLGVGSCQLATEGLKWNLGDYESGVMGSLEFGHFISSSNQLVGKHVKVNTNQPIFLSTSRKSL